jgi:SH3-like domain-containing protein
MKKHMKKRIWLPVLTSIILVLGSVAPAYAEILPSRGFGQIGLTSYVLCDSLSLYEKPDTDSKVVETLEYGKMIIVTDEADGWARCVLGDSEDSESGWVKSDFIAIDPERYKTEDWTPVYAWGSTKANKVALLSADTTLPILKNEGDWVVVSLRGASGWIQK